MGLIVAQVPYQGRAGMGFLSREEGSPLPLACANIAARKLMCGAERVPEAESGGGLNCCHVRALLLHSHTECVGGQDVDEVQLLLKEGRMVLFR